MANIVGELLLKYVGDATLAVKEANKVELALENISKSAKKTKDDLTKFTVETAGLWKGWANEVGEDTRDLWEGVEALNEKLKIQGKSLGVSTTGFVTMAVQAKGAETKLQDFGKALNSVSSKLWVVTMGLQQMGRALVTSLTLPLAGVATLAVKTFADWEQGTKILQASADLTEKQAQGLTDQFRELALVMPLTVKELQQIAITAAEAGVGLENIERYTIAIAKLVTISEELGLKNAAETLVAVSKAFGIAEENVERVGSVIRKMAKEARGGMDDFVAGMLRAIPAAATLNIGFEDMAAMLAAIIPVSGTASRAGTELNTMFDQMSRNLPKLAAQMGITEESLKEMISKDAVATLKMYVEGLQVQGDQIEKNQAILEIFGSTGAKALRLLISQYDEFNKRQGEAHEAFREGIELTKDYEIVADSLTNTFKIFGNAVLEVAHVIGEDLAPIIKRFLETAIVGLTTLASLWISLPDPVKKVVIVIAGLLAVLGPLILLINTLISPIVGLVTVVAKAAGVLIAFKAAGSAMTVTLGTIKTTLGAVLLAFGKFILIAAGVVWAIIEIYKELDKLFNITEKLKEALGITAFTQRFEDAQQKIKTALGKIDDSVSETIENLKKKTAVMGILAAEWGDKIMERFLYGFTKADFGILDDAMRIVESYFNVLEQQGKASTETIYRNTLEARRLIAKAIYEVKQLGEISAETTRELEALVGAARIESIAKQIIAAIKVEEIEEAIDKINDEIKERRRALKRETAIIDKAIDERKDEYDDQIEEQEKVIKLLQKRKRDNERQYKTELRTLEDIVEIAEEERDIARDRLDAIKESNDLFIETLQEQRDALRDNVDETRETLDELRDLRKEEVDTAEGMLDYAKMNLEAATNQLKKEKALGKDEWDASFRAAEARVDTAQEQVDLAYATYIKTKKLYQKEEKVLKDELAIAEKDLKLKDKEIRDQRRIDQAEERIVEEELDMAEDALKAARRALDDFRDAYKEQSDLLSDEIDERQAMVADFKDARDEILNTLKKERDAVNEKYQGEINILEDRLDVAQTALDTTKKLLATEEGINAQRLKLEAERLKAAQEMAPTEFPGIAAGDFDEFLRKMNEATETYNEMLDTMEKGTEEKAPTIGKSLLAAIFPPYGLYLAAQEFFSSEKWENIKRWVKDTIEKIDWGTVGKTILGLLFPPYGLYLILTNVFNIDWEKVKEDIASFVTQIDWQKVGRTILGLLFPPYGIYQILTSVFNIDWNKVKNDLATFVGNIDWGLVGRTILGALFAGPIAIGNLGAQIYNSIVSGLQDLGPALQNIGAWIGQTIASGLNLAKDVFKNAANVIFGVAEGLNEKWGEIKDWGKNIGGNIASGVYNAWNNMKDAAKNIVGGIGSGLSDTWNQIKDWGKTTGQQLASGVYDAWWKMYDGAKNILGGIASGINDKMNDIWNWGKSIGQQVANGVYGAYEAIKNAAKWIANVFKSFLGWWSAPKEGPMSTGEEWMPNMIKTLAQGIVRSLPTIDRAVSQVGESIMGISANQPIVGTGAVAGVQGAIQGVAAPALAGAGMQPGISKQTIINLQPGMMIASKGEVRAFARMLGRVQETEAQRTGLEE